MIRLTEKELRLIRTFGPPRPGRKPSLQIASIQVWMALRRKRILDDYLGVTPPAGDEVLAWMLGEYVVVPEKVGQA